MVKAYLRYEQAAAFGVITSGSNIVHDLSGKHVLTAALESIAVWNLKQGTLVSGCTLRWQHSNSKHLNRHDSFSSLTA